MKKDNLKFIDLFAGIGGIRIAFERAGAKCVWASEWDEASQDMYEANFGHRPAGDITKVLSAEIPNHDILTGGFPCQAFSIIGDRQGFADTRGTLFFEVERILRDKQPYAFLLENVKQLTTHDDGRTFKVILDHLQNLDYFVHWKVLNALNYGWPQKRERVLMVGFKKNHPFEFPNGHLKTPIATLAGLLEPDDKVDKKHFISSRIAQKLKNKTKDKKIFYPSIWHENKAGNIGIHPFSCALRANASYNYLLVNGVRRPTPRENLRFMGFPDSFKIVVNDFQVRKQAGNSVVIPTIESVARAMVEAMKKPPIKPVKEAIQASIFEPAESPRLTEKIYAKYN